MEIGFSKYTDDMFAAMNKYLILVDENFSEEEFLEILYDQLLNLGENSEPKTSQLPFSEYVFTVFNGFMEIFNSNHNLVDIEFYIGRFPYENSIYENSIIVRSRYLRYHIENYFEEIYILKNRMCAYPKLINRAKSKYFGSSDITKLVDHLEQKVEEDFKKLVGIRGRHVHKRRYDDKDLRQLETWEILASNFIGKSQKYSLNFIKEMKRNNKIITNKWIKNIRLLNIGVNNILDAYFETLYPFVFTINREIRMLCNLEE